MRLDKNFAGIPYLYRKNGAVSTVIDIRMKDKISLSFLQDALNFTVSRHPYFRSSVLEKKGDYYIVDNDKPFQVSETKTLRRLGSQEVNFHLIDVTFYEKQIFVAFHHGLCDGLGARRFAETLLRCYCGIKYGIPMDNEYSMPSMAEDTLDPFGNEMYEVEKAAMPKVNKDGCSLPEIPQKLSSDSIYRFEFTLHNNSLLKYAKKHHATPSIAVALLMSKAIKNVHKNTEKAIVCSLACDLRDGLHAEKTFKNCVNSIYLPYTEEMEQENIAELADDYRKMMKEQREEAYIKQNANHMIYLFNELAKLPSLEAKEKMMEPFDNLKINTYVLSYLGKANLSNCEPFIDSMHLYSGGNNGLIVNMMAVGDTIAIDLLQSFESMEYKDNFQLLLEEAGIEFEVSDKIVFSTPRDGIHETAAMEKVRKVNCNYAV